MKKWFPKSWVWIVALIFIGLIVATQTRFTECLSESLSGVKYLLFLKHSRPQHNDIVLIKGHQEEHISHLPSWPYAKRVLGLPGDQIQRNQAAIRVEWKNCKTNPCSSQLLPLLKHTRKGKSLTPISVGVIPEGFIFVAGHNPQSFDSRYEEFGLVPLEKVWGKAVFTW